MAPIVEGRIKVRLLWFDSLGAKSSCILIETPDLRLLVDPGVAAMQPGYPLPETEKVRLEKKAFRAIVKAARRADHIFISHYHNDHHISPLESPDLYRGKVVWVKDPNQWINQSQWDRSRDFAERLYETVSGSTTNTLTTKPKKSKFPDPLDDLPLAKSKDYGSYQSRKLELLDKGRRWFNKMARVWATEPWVCEFESGHTKLRFADGKSFTIGNTAVRFTKPFFHGIEYDRVGWVIGLTLEHEGVKVLYTSDVQGPSIEDYAYWIISETPDIAVIDGPATYLFGYMVNRINLQRAIDNAIAIIRNSRAKVIIYDHHLPRDRLYRKRLQAVYDTATECHKVFVTAAEWLGKEPLILTLSEK